MTDGDETEGQRTEVPDTLEAQPEGRAATPPGRDPEHPEAPGPEASERTDLNPAATSKPKRPEGRARP